MAQLTALFGARRAARKSVEHLEAVRATPLVCDILDRRIALAASDVGAVHAG